MTKENYSRAIASFVAKTEFNDLPKVVVDRAKLVIRDCVGIALGAYGTKHELVRSMIEFVREMDGKRESTVLGEGLKTTCPDAVMVNSVMANFLDSSDGYYLGGHINDRIVPAALAVAEREGANSRDLIASVVLGYEVCIRLARALFKKTESASVRTPYFVLLGSVASAVSAGKLLRLDEDQIAGAMGLASSIQIFGAQYSISGGHEKDLVPGHESRRGVLSALLAGKGILGSKDIIDGSRGICHAINNECDFDELVEDLGRKYWISECYFKPYPACRFLHSSIEASLNIKKKWGVEAEEVQEIIVKTNSSSAARTNYNIASHVAAIFSHPYQAAVAIKYGRADLPIKWKEKMQDPAFVELMNKIKVEADPLFDKMFQERTSEVGMWPAKVIVKMKTDKTFESTVLSPKGDSGNPMTAEELREKFFHFTSNILTRQQAMEIVNYLDRLEEVKLNELISMLSKKLD